MKNQLTDRQNQILSFILEFRNENGYPPTLREIGKRFGIASTFGVKRHLEALIKKGFIHVEVNASRGISVLNELFDEAGKTLKNFIEQDVFSQIPIIGRVSAGLPITAVENIEGNIVVDSSFLRKNNSCFALKVKGDSMINAGIFEGDLVIISPQQEVNNNDIVIAIIGDDVTVKRFVKNDSQIFLKAENINYNPIEVTNNENFRILGKVIGVTRWFN